MKIAKTDNVSHLIKRLTVFFAVFAAAMSISVSASANSISDLGIKVVLSENGDARITETYTAAMDRDTEMYLIKDNMRDMKIQDLSVKDIYNGIEYINEGEWNVDRSREEKAGKCGIVTKSSGCEICWGIGEYGNHVYEVSYTMTNMVQAFTDYNGFNIRFFNDDFSFPPEKIHLTIEKEGLEFTSDDTKVWAFGFDGEIWVQDGKVAAWTNSAMSKKNHFTVMVRFDPSMFTPVSTADYSFSVLEEEAKKGSDYNNDDVDFDSPIKMMIKMVLMSVACFFMSFLVGKIMRPPSSTKNKKLYKHTDVSAVFNAQWCRTIPFDGNIPFTYYVTSASEKDKEGALIGAYLLRWAKKDYLKFAYTESKGFLGLGKTMQPSVIFALGAQLDMSSNEYLLYCMLFEASGGDAVLQEKEFYNWSRHNYQKVFDWYESVENESERLMMGSGLLQEEERRAFLLYKVKDITLTQQGAQKACEVYGFKNYLKDFTIINERRPVEVELWDDYLVFATLFGIADEVAKEFKDIYPDHFAQMSMSYGGSGMDMYATMQIVRSVYYAGRHGADVGRPSSVGSSSGGGGGSSGGGGGGSSGGGSGGGSR